MISIILNALVPIYFVLALGYLAGRFKRVDNRRVAELNALVMEFALPASLFAATLRTPSQALIGQWPMVVVLGVGMLVIYAIAYFLQRRVFGLGTQEAAVQALTIALPNYAAAGLPLISSVFGQSQIILVAISIACGSIIVSPLTLTLLEVGKSDNQSGLTFGRIVRSMRNSVLKPIVMAPILGVLLSLLGVSLPPLLGSSLDLIGRAAGGVALFLTGLILSAQPFKLNANVVSGTLLKNIVHPLVAIGIVMLVPMPAEIARAAIILSAVPSGFFGILFGLRYGVQSQQAGSTLIASSVLSAITVAAAILLPTPGGTAGRPKTPDITLDLQMHYLVASAPYTDMTWRERRQRMLCSNR
jgi:malonate transporter